VISQVDESITGKEPLVSSHVVSTADPGNDGILDTEVRVVVQAIACHRN
jgi:hypothetical protein